MFFFSSPIPSKTNHSHGEISHPQIVPYMFQKTGQILVLVLKRYKPKKVSITGLSPTTQSGKNINHPATSERNALKYTAKSNVTPPMYMVIAIQLDAIVVFLYKQFFILLTLHERYQIILSSIFITTEIVKPKEEKQQ